MSKDGDLADTPSLIGREITTARPGQSLRYSELTALEKRDYLFDEGVRATAYEGDERPGVHSGVPQFLGAAFESISDHLLGQTLLHASDELAEPKRKLFHTFGTTAKVVFVPAADTPYTGLFAERCHGLARFSYAGPVHGVGIVPGLGLKFPVSGEHPSENAVVMYGLDRQRGRSVFEKPFTNILPIPKLRNVVMRAVNKRFETVVAEGHGLHQPVDNLARVQADGRAVPAAEVRAPHRLILVPTGEARERSDGKADFRDDLAGNFPPGSTLYRVLALEEEVESSLPGGGKKGHKLEALTPHAREIGTLATESAFVASKYGDYRLFFQHNRGFLRPELAPT